MPSSVGHVRRQIYATAFINVLFITAECSIRGKKQESYENATQRCASFGKGLKLDDPSSYINVGKGGVLAAWLPYRRIIYEEYTWVDDTYAENNIISIGSELGHACGALDLENGQYDFLPCHHGGASFFCQMKGCISCYSIGMTKYECFVYGDDCFTFHCGSSNWYRAREACLKLGGDLALIKDKNVIPHFKRFWKTSYQGPCNTAWIGLYKELWKTDEKELPKTSYWAADEPTEIGDCSIMFMDREELMWRAVSCKENHWYFCTEDKVPSTSTRNSRTQDFMNHGLSATTPIPYTTKDHFPRNTVSIVTLIVSLVLVLAMLILMKENIISLKRLHSLFRKWLSAERQVVASNNNSEETRSSEDDSQTSRLIVTGACAARCNIEEEPVIKNKEAKLGKAKTKGTEQGKPHVVKEMKRVATCTGNDVPVSKSNSEGGGAEQKECASGGCRQRKFENSKHE